MKTIMGVHSLEALNHKLKNGYTMHDWVKRQRGYPHFCLRALTGEDELTETEAAFLHDRKCKIGLLLCDLTEVQVSSRRDKGVAEKAVQAAKKLGVPQNAGIAIFAEIKPEWSVNHNWMLSFANHLIAHGYIPGFIGNTDSSKNFVFDRETSHYVEATMDTNGYSAVYGATEPKCDGFPLEWAPFCPSALNPDEMSLWVCGTTTFDAEQVEIAYARDEQVLERFW